jgi:hypothetical protein
LPSTNAQKTQNINFLYIPSLPLVLCTAELWALNTRSRSTIITATMKYAEKYECEKYKRNKYSKEKLKTK